MALYLTKKTAQNTFFYIRGLVKFALERGFSCLNFGKNLDFSFGNLRQKIVPLLFEQPILLVNLSLIVKIKLFKVSQQTLLHGLYNSINRLFVCLVQVGITFSHSH